MIFVEKPDIIMYWNVNGLNGTKLKYICSKVLERQYSVAIVAETWFPKKMELETNPFFVCHSTRPKNARDGGHENGGIAIFAHPVFAKHISDIRREEFSISFNYKGRIIVAVYLPPRLTEIELELILSRIPASTDIIIGDINVRYGKINKDKISTNPRRRLLISNLCESRNLQHMIASNTCSRNDHVFAREIIDWTYEYPATSTIWSDHSMMVIKLMDKEEKTFPTSTHYYAEESQQRPSRYSWKPLESATFRKLVCFHYDNYIFKDIHSIISQTQNFIEREKVTDRNVVQGIIDGVYDCFIEGLYNLCDTFFIKYDPEEIKTNASTLGKDKLSNRTAIRIFKLSHRSSSTQNNIKASKEHTDVLHEAFSIYTMTYNERHKNFDEDVPAPEVKVMQGDLTTGKEIKRVIAKYPCMKSGGLDNLDTRLFKTLLESKFPETLARLFNLLHSISVTPAQWNISLIHLIPKDMADTRVTKTRPISLTAILRRIFEKLLLKKWLNEHWTSLHRTQAGFRRGFSTYSHIMLSDELTKRGKDISVFLDIKAAYDKVPFSRLVKVLKEKRCPDHTVSLIFSLMIHNCSSKISVNRRMHKDNIIRRHGLFQGSIISPLLFNIFIDNLAMELNRGQSDIRAMLFADDVVIKAKNHSEAQRLLDIAYNWARENGMTWGITKCGVVTKRPILPLMLDGEELPVVNSYKYLGVPHEAKGIAWETYVRQLTEKTRKMIAMLSVKGKHWHPKTKLIIYKTFVRPTSEYCLPLVTKYIKTKDKKQQDLLIRKFTDTHNEAISWIFDIKGATIVLEYLAGLQPTECRITKLEASLAKHLKELHQDNPLRQLTRMLSAPIGDSILHSSFKNDLLSDFLRQQKEKPKISWRAHVKRHERSAVSLRPGILQHYVRPRAFQVNGVPTSIDRLMDQEKSVLLTAAKWRANRLFIGRRCNCGSRFNRRHIRDCRLLQVASGGESEDIQEILQEMKRKRGKYSEGFEHTYSLMDQALNDQEYGQFMRYVKIIEGQLEKIEGGSHATA
jgi:hypothetical protein